MGFFASRKVLVTGGTGLIGRPLTEMLVSQGACVTVASLDDPSRAPRGCEFKRVDLREWTHCLEVCAGQEIVFHLAGVKGSPAMAARRPASFFVPMLQFSVNMMEAARKSGVGHYLFASSVGVYSPAEMCREDDVWSTFPSPNDRFAGWAKRMGELQAEAHRIEHGWDAVSIVRPANVYGPYDNFDPANAMVIPSLIRRVVEGENPLTVWGDGSPVRDFIHARDVARGMMLMVQKGVREPVNLGSGAAVTIGEVAAIIARCAPGGPVTLAWDASKPKGDARRLMDASRAASLGFRCEVPLEEGIRETMAWYAAHCAEGTMRYNPFGDGSPPS